MKLRRIRKRDGREVPFDKTKISDAVSRAQAAVGAPDPHFAAEVADIVEMALLRRHAAAEGRHAAGESVPGIEEIQDLVEQALIELGHAAVAKAYILYRDRRARIRGALEVRGEPADSALRDAHATPPAAATGADAASRRRGLPRVQVSGGVTTWSKGRIVVALMSEADLPRATAEHVAARVEERVFDSGLKRISTGLIRELVDNELVDQGLAQALRRQRPVVVPRHDVRRLLAEPAAFATRAALPPGVAGREPLGSESPAETLGGALLARYAVEDILPESVAELHLAGELGFEDLERAHLALTQSVPCELLRASEGGARSAFELLEEVARLAQRTSYGVVIEDAEVVLQSLVRGARGTARAGGAALPSWLLALSAVARGAGRAIDLSFGPLAPARERASSGGRASGAATMPAWLPRLCEELAELAADADRPRLPRLFLGSDDLALLAQDEPGVRDALERLLAQGLVVPGWSVAGERCVAPGLTRAWRERGALVCGGACALNLARAARRAGPWREDALLENVARLLEGALDGLAALQEFQRRERWLDGAPRGLVRGRVSYAIVPVGMREALRLVADGELRPEQAARLHSFLAEAVQRFSKQRGLPVVLTPWFGERSALRFAQLDREFFQASQALLFDPGERAGAPGGAAVYSTGLDLSPAAGAPNIAGSALEAAQAALCAAQKSGALHPPQLLRALAHGAHDERPSVLAAWERLERVRSRLRSGAWALYALPPADGDAGSVAERHASASPSLYESEHARGPAVPAAPLRHADDPLAHATHEPADDSFHEPTFASDAGSGAPHVPAAQAAAVNAVPREET